MTIERPQLTEGTTPSELLAQYQADPIFDNRLLANFFSSRTDPDSLKIRPKNSSVFIEGAVLNSGLSFSMTIGSREALLQINGPDGEELNKMRRQTPNINVYLGGIEFSAPRFLHPHAPEVAKLQAEITELNRQTRSVDEVIRGDSSILSTPESRATVDLFKKYAEPFSVQAGFDYNSQIVQLHGYIPGEVRESPLGFTLKSPHTLLWFRGRGPFQNPSLLHGYNCRVDWTLEEGENYSRESYPVSTKFKLSEDKILSSESHSVPRNSKRGILGREMFQYLRQRYSLHLQVENPRQFGQ